jgi:hypothetical protein
MLLGVERSSLKEQLYMVRSPHRKTEISSHSVHPVLKHELFYESNFTRQLTFIIMPRKWLPKIVNLQIKLSALLLIVPLA